LQVDRAISAEEGHFIAGFIEGEGHLGIAEANGGQSFRCLMSLRVRDDDTPLVEWLQARTGIGVIHAVPARATSNPQIQWLVRTQADCSKLVDLLTRFELRGRKRSEFAVWARAVETWTSRAPDRVDVAHDLRQRLIRQRLFVVPERASVVETPASSAALDSYLHGFLCAEGSLHLDKSHTSLSVHLRQDDRPLLEMFARALGVGTVKDHKAYPPSRPATIWRVGRLDEVAYLAKRLDPERLRGRKAAELAIWLQAVQERREARTAGRAPRMDAFVAEFRAARAYRPGEPPPPADRATAAREHALRVLRRWAAREDGPLSVTRYDEARQPEWPDRNTIARRFGSWHAALEAAGLAERAASTPAARDARRDGAARARETHRAEQRERVLATLRFAVHIDGAGTLPTAMQFFRWRLINAPATPTQATVYRLFPGGWPAVLAAYEASGAHPSFA
jgi:hypothetical protein